MRALMRWIWPMFRRRWRSLLLSLLLALLTAFAAVGLLGVAGWFLTATALAAGALGSFNLFMPSAMVRALAFTRILSRYGERITGHGATMHLLSDLRARVFGDLLRLDAGQLRRWRDGDLAARLTGDIDTLDTVFLQSLQPLLVAAVVGCALVATLAFYMPWAALGVGILWGLCLLIVPVWLATRVRFTGIERQQQAAELRQQVMQAVEGHADVLALHAGQRAESEFSAACDRLRKAALCDARWAGVSQATLLLAGGLAMLMATVAGAMALEAGLLGGALLVGLVLAVAGLFDAIGPVLRGALRLGGATAAAARVREIEEGRPRVVDEGANDPVAPAAVLLCRQLGFRHHSELPLLEGIDLRIEPGQRVVLTGASGSGKSTLLALLMRLLDPQQGEVLWDDRPLRAISLSALHRHVAMLSQESVVFLGSVRDNLLLAEPDAADDELWQVLQAAGFDEEVRAMPGQLDQWLGEGGRTLSGGQARRLCLARVLLRRAALIILDEPTEGLDPMAEQRFLTSLPEILQGRSLLLVTHAPVPPQLADLTLKLENGRLIRVS